jgi:cytochrome c553
MLLLVVHHVFGDSEMQSISRSFLGQFLVLSISGLLSILFLNGCSKQASTPHPGSQKAVVCLSCHGADGNGGPDPAVPKLANQSYPYLISAMKSYADGRRNHEPMKTFVAGLSEADIQDIAGFYSSQRAR